MRGFSLYKFYFYNVRENLKQSHILNRLRAFEIFIKIFKNDHLYLINIVLLQYLK